ncbi:hypothetical protein K2Y11_18570 [bacterium]|nr:hypothetical protein [bacterium]
MDRILGAATDATSKSRRDEFLLKGIRSDLDRLVSGVDGIVPLLTNLKNNLTSVRGAVANFGLPFRSTLPRLDTQINNLQGLINHLSAKKTAALGVSSVAPDPANDEEIETLNGLSEEIDAEFEYLNAPNGPAAFLDSVLVTLRSRASVMENLQVPYADYAAAIENFVTGVSSVGPAISQILASGQIIIGCLEDASEASTLDIDFRNKGLDADLEKLRDRLLAFENQLVSLRNRLVAVKNSVARPPAFDEENRLQAAISTLNLRIGELDYFLFPV